MKSRNLFLIAVIISLLFCFGSIAYSQEDMEEVDNSVFEKPQRVSAVFKHDEHNEKAGLDECSACHHIYKDGKIVEDESSEDQSCSDCHQLKASGNSPGLMKAFHTSCISCHKSGKKGPVMCGECHVKK